jgi:hypothetical protein
MQVVHSATSATMCCGDATAAMLETQRIKASRGRHCHFHRK